MKMNCLGRKGDNLRKRKQMDMESLLAQMPDTGFGGTNEEAEHVASHPEEWEPVILLSRGQK